MHLNLEQSHSTDLRAGSIPKKPQASIIPNSSSNSNILLANTNANLLQVNNSNALNVTGAPSQ